MLARWFDDTQHLFEGGFHADVTPTGVAHFEVDEGSESDLSDLEALVAAADPPTGDWSDQVSPLLDLEQATRMWAVEIYTGHWDGYAPDREFLSKPNNFYLHSDESGRFSMLPWGTDLALGRRVPFDQPAGLLFRRCLAGPELPRALPRRRRRGPRGCARPRAGGPRHLHGSRARTLAGARSPPRVLARADRERAQRRARLPAGAPRRRRRLAGRQPDRRARRSGRAHRAHRPTRSMQEDQESPRRARSGRSAAGRSGR